MLPPTHEPKHNDINDKIGHSCDTLFQASSFTLSAYSKTLMIDFTTGKPVVLNLCSRKHEWSQVLPPKV